MPFNRPTLSQIIARIEGDFTIRFGAQASKLRRAWTSIVSRAYGGSVHLLYGFLEWISKQMFTDTSDAEELIREAGLYGLTLKPADFAQGNITTTGTVGTSVPAGTAWLRSDNLRYTLVATTVQGAGATAMAVVAETAGSSGNLAAAQAVTLESPIPGLLAPAVIAAGGITGGIDEETIEELRSRLLQRKRKPAQGGSKADLEAWALEVTGVAQAFVYRPKDIQDSPPIPPFGTAYVYIATSDPVDPVPGVGLVADVQVYLDDRKEVTATIAVYAIDVVTVNFTINIALTAGFTLTQSEEEITAELVDLFLREGVPNALLRLSQLNEAISSAASEDSHDLTLPAADITLAADQIARVGTVTVLPF